MTSAWGLIRMLVYMLVAQSCLTLYNPIDCIDPIQPERPFCPWNSPGNNAGVGSHFLLQGIFPSPGIEPGSPALQADSLPSEPILNIKSGTSEIPRVGVMGLIFLLDKIIVFEGVLR